MNRQELITFEKQVAMLFEQKKIKVPIHLSKGNEEELIKIFKDIKKDDYVFSTHRNHYHYLLHTGNKQGLLDEILCKETGVCMGKSGSMHTIDRKNNFFSSGIVAGCVSIAVGVAWALKQKKSKKRVWIFIGDGATDSGFSQEALEYAERNDLPIRFIVENNDRSVVATKKQRWGRFLTEKYFPYRYKCGYPHSGVGKWITF